MKTLSLMIRLFPSQILLGAVILCLFQTRAKAQSVTDCTPINIRCAGSSQEYTHLQSAADMVNPGDTVLVFDGNYTGFKVTRSGSSGSPVTFIANGSSVIINSGEPTEGHGVYLSNVNYITIDGFTFQSLGGRCIASHNATPTSPMTGLTIRNNHCSNATLEGFYLSEVSNSLIEKNTNSQSGTSGATRSHGIYLANGGSDNTTLRGNTIFQNTTAESSGIPFNGDASVGGDGIISGLFVKKNIIYGNGQNGFNLDSVQGSTFKNNLVYGNVRHAFRAYKIDGAQGPKNVKIYNNTFLNPSMGGWAVKFTEDLGGHTLFNNILISDSSTVGSIEIATLAGFSGSNNAVVNRFSKDGNDTLITFSQWQAHGVDTNSFATNPAALSVNPSGSNYELLRAAPAIDTGLASFGGIAGPTTDLKNAPRPQGSAYDIGAYEHASSTSDTTPPPSPKGLVVE